VICNIIERLAKVERKRVKGVKGNNREVPFCCQSEMARGLKGACFIVLRAGYQWIVMRITQEKRWRCAGFTD
jgi:hypothetical protein